MANSSYSSMYKPLPHLCIIYATASYLNCYWNLPWRQNYGTPYFSNIYPYDTKGINKHMVTTTLWAKRTILVPFYMGNLRHGKKYAFYYYLFTVPIWRDPWDLIFSAYIANTFIIQLRHWSQQLSLQQLAKNTIGLCNKKLWTAFNLTGNHSTLTRHNPLDLSLPQPVQKFPQTKADIDNSLLYFMTPQKYAFGAGENPTDKRLGLIILGYVIMYTQELQEGSPGYIIYFYCAIN